MLTFSKRNINFLAIGLSIIIFTFINFYLIYAQEHSKEQITEKGSIIETNIIEKEITQAEIVQDNITVNEISQSELVDQEYIEENIGDSEIWKIQIPKISLDAPISKGTSQETMLKTVGHFEESQIWNGNVALAAHNRGNDCNFFQNIKLLEKGDKIIYKTKEGTKEYQVEINTIISDSDWSFIVDTEDNRITLITCVENEPDYRRCVQAIEIK